MGWLLLALLLGLPCSGSLQPILLNVALCAATHQLACLTAQPQRMSSVRRWAHGGMLLAAICSMPHFLQFLSFPACMARPFAVMVLSDCRQTAKTSRCCPASQASPGSMIPPSQMLLPACAPYWDHLGQVGCCA